MNPVIVLKALLAVLLTSPLVWLAWRISLDIQQPGTGLGADAGEYLVHYLGEWSLVMVLTAFTISPLRRWTNYAGWLRSRRMVGLFAFSYVVLHLTSYVYFYLGFSWPALLEDFVERAYITAGMLGFFCLLLMSVTSTRGWQRRLRHRWQQLHQLIYLAIAAGLVHLWWLTREGYLEVTLYSLWFALLCIERWSVDRKLSWRSGVQSPPG
ncbi:MAG: sulfite oxidase heme-binding subunit YedZ [bacterium]